MERDVSDTQVKDDLDVDATSIIDDLETHEQAMYDPFESPHPYNTSLFLSTTSNDFPSLRILHNTIGGGHNKNAIKLFS